MPTNTRSLSVAGADLLREISNLVRTGARVLALQLPEDQRRARPAGRNVLRNRDPEAAEAARAEIERSANRMSEVALGLVQFFSETGKTLAAQVAPGADDRISATSGDFDCCDIEQFRHVSRMRVALLTMELGRYIHASEEFLDSWECIHDCPPHPCSPEIEDVIDRGDFPDAVLAKVERSRSAGARPRAGRGRRGRTGGASAS